MTGWKNQNGEPITVPELLLRAVVAEVVVRTPERGKFHQTLLSIEAIAVRAARLMPIPFGIQGFGGSPLPDTQQVYLNLYKLKQRRRVAEYDGKYRIPRHILVSLWYDCQGVMEAARRDQYPLPHGHYGYGLDESAKSEVEDGERPATKKVTLAGFLRGQKAGEVE